MGGTTDLAFEKSNVKCQYFKHDINFMLEKRLIQHRAMRLHWLRIFYERVFHMVLLMQR